MKTCNFTIKGVGPMSQSKPIGSKKNTGESHDAFEDRTWKERLHVDDSGEVYIPPSAIKNMLSDVAKYLSETVPGKGKATYTKHFDAGILCFEPIGLGIKADTIPGERLFVPSDGRRGGGSRVWKTFPKIDGWKGSGSIVLVDPILIDKPEKVREYLEHAGRFIGLGRFRPRNGGFYGRFVVEGWEVFEGTAAAA